VTPRIYFDDAFVRSFSARIVALSRFGEQPSVVLDRTAFYPEAGGQMADRGALGGRDVIDVQVGDDGIVHHMLASLEGLEVGAELEGAIAWPRRRVHMALHTGQHMLSRALEDEAGAATVSSRLGENECTIDVDKNTLDEAKVARAEALVNSVIDDDVLVRAWFPEAAELAALPLRRKPKVDKDIRVVKIGDFDCSPCGGTHCARSAEVGLVHVTSIERYKGKARVTFSAGKRARDGLFEASTVLRGLGRELSCGATDVPAALGKMRREMLAAKETLGRARIQLAESIARDLVAAAVARGEDNVIATIEDSSIEMLRALAGRIVAALPSGAALLAAPVDDAQLIVATRGASSTFDCGAFVKRAAALSAGRGGGRPEHAEGRVPREVDWADLARRA
jgi:alanyl-tRNA synthetase